MEPRIVEKAEIVLVGMASRANYPDIGPLWQTFMAQQSLIQHVVEGAWYELHAYPAGYTCGQPFTLMVGVEVRRLEALPDLMFAKVLPSGLYTIFTHRLADGGFSGANQPIDRWLQSAAYERSHEFDLQVFDSRFKGPDNPDSVLEFWIPVRAKQ